MFSNQAVLSACLITLLGLVSTRLILQAEQSNGAFLYPHESRERHGGTYITSDNFPAQKIGCQDSVALHYIPYPEGYSLG